MKCGVKGGLENYIRLVSVMFEYAYDGFSVLSANIAKCKQFALPNAKKMNSNKQEREQVGYAE